MNLGWAGLSVEGGISRVSRRFINKRRNKLIGSIRLTIRTAGNKRVMVIMRVVASFYRADVKYGEISNSRFEAALIFQDRPR